MEIKHKKIKKILVSIVSTISSVYLSTWAEPIVSSCINFFQITNSSIQDFCYTLPIALFILIIEPIIYELFINRYYVAISWSNLDGENKEALLFKRNSIDMFEQNRIKAKISLCLSENLMKSLNYLKAEMRVKFATNMDIQAHPSDTDQWSSYPLVDEIENRELRINAINQYSTPKTDIKYSYPIILKPLNHHFEQNEMHAYIYYRNNANTPKNLVCRAFVCIRLKTAFISLKIRGR